MVVLLGSGPVLWMIGGLFWKAARRFVWPLEVLVILCMSNNDNKVWYKYTLAALAMIGVNGLAYGDNTEPWLRIVVFASYIVPAFIINKQAGIIMAFPTGLVLVLLMRMSLAHNEFTWKIWEASAGLIQAASILVARQLEKRG